LQKVDAEKSSRQLWRSIDVLLGRGTVTSDTFSTQQFHDFLDAKVDSVRSSTDGALLPSFTQSPIEEVYMF